MAKPAKKNRNNVKKASKTKTAPSTEKVVTPLNLQDSLNLQSNDKFDSNEATQQVQLEATKESFIARFVKVARSHLSLYTVALLALIAFMLYVRIVPSYSQVFTNWPWTNGATYVNVAADDGVMEMRLVFNTIAHFPFRIFYDPFTHYPYGSEVHFGPLFTYLLALPSLILGLGHPSTQLVEDCAAYVPTVIGALCVIPTYYIAKKLFGRKAALFASIVLAFSSGAFLYRMIIGATYHESAEVLFMALTVAVLLYAIDATRSLTFDALKRRDSAVLKPVLWAVLVGLVYGCYFWEWPGAPLLGFMITIYFAVQMILDHVHGRSLDSTLILAVPTFIIPAIMVLPLSLTDLVFLPINYSITQPFLMLLAIASLVIIYALSFLLNRSKVSKLAFPIVLLGIGVVFVLGTGLFDHSVLNTITSSLGFLYPNANMLTVEEAMPTFIDIATKTFTLSQYWGMFYYAGIIYFIGVVILILRLFKQVRPAELMFLIWNLGMLWLLYDQVRFAYYFAVNVALVAGFVAYEVYNALDLGKLEEGFVKKVKTWDDFSKFVKKNTGRCIVATIAVLALLFVAMYPALPMSDPYGRNQEGTLWYTASGGAATVPYEWFESLNWMRTHTPDPQGNPVSSSFDYANGTYTQPPIGQKFNYPSSAYGVMSWWDYGHDIEYIANRIPNANPFQAGIIEENGTAGPSYFFTSQNETSAYNNLNKLGSRYVVIDYQMATGKFPAITEWINDTSGWFDTAAANLGGTSGSVGLNIDSSKFYNSTMYRLYYGDCDGMSHFRLVHDSAGDYTISFAYANLQSQYVNMFATKTVSNYTDAYSLQQSAINPTWINTGTDLIWGARPPVKYVKVFEKVKGATITGNAPDGSLVNASVTLQSQDRQFTYTNSGVAQNGTYSITVPYASEPMNGTDYSSDVVPITKYTIEYGNTTRTVDVPESAVMNGDAVQVN